MSNTNTPSNTTPAGTTPTHAIPLSPEAEEEEEDDEPFSVFQDFDSESSGGMQIDPIYPPHEMTSTAFNQEAQAWESQRDGASYPSPLLYRLKHMRKPMLKRPQQDFSVPSLQTQVNTV